MLPEPPALKGHTLVNTLCTGIDSYDFDGDSMSSVGWRTLQTVSVISSLDQSKGSAAGNRTRPLAFRAAGPAPSTPTFCSR